MSTQAAAPVATPLVAPPARQHPGAFALVDGNNFYASCERVFEPRLIGRPLVVLSNNDGCAIARSEEAKALGIAMGAPWFRIRHLEQQAGLVALSANFSLYGDMSQRLMEVAAALGCGQEIYSIDECFIDLAGVPDASARARQTRERIQRWLGLPTCIGIGPTKTLAKLANHIAKSAERKPGSYPARLAQVCNLLELSARQRDWLLQRTPVAEVWGVGPRWAAQLQAHGVQTALQLQRLDPALVRQRWSVVLERTVRELGGLACIGLEQAPAPKQQIACTRSFGQPVTELDDLRQALSHFCSRAALKLRQQGSRAGALLVFIRTSPFRPQDAPYARSLVLPLSPPSDDTVRLVGAALQALQALYRPGYRYAKAGVMLLDLQAAPPQATLDWGAPDEDGGDGEGSGRSQRLMQALDAVNARFGAQALRLGSSGGGGGPPAPGCAEPAARPWQMRQQRRSPRYTTRWDELWQVRA